MTRMRNLKGLILLFVFVVMFVFSVALVTSEPAQAKPCECWVMYCTVNPPIYCWEECIPCPPLWP